MKRKITRYAILAILLIPFFTYAQSEYNSSYYTDHHLNYNYGLKNKDGIKTKKVELKNEKGVYQTTIYTYNEKGYVLSEERINKKSKKKYTKKWEYDKDDNLIKYSFFRGNGKIKHYAIFKWKSPLQLIEKTIYNSKDVIAYRSTWTFNEKGNLQESIRYKKEGQKIERQWKYVYDKEGNKLQTQLFNSKGVLIHSWSYDCHEEGVKLEKEKKKTQVCTWSEDQGKYLIKTYQRFNEKGEIRKWVTKYTIADTTIVSSKSYDENDSLVWVSNYNEKGRRVYSASYKKGKLYYENTTHYENDKVVKRTFNYKGKNRSTTTYVYSSEGLLLKATNTPENGKRITSSQFTYDFY